MKTPVKMAIGLLCIAGCVTAQDPDPDPEKMKARMEEMKRLLEQARPGPEHQRLMRYAGQWELTVEFGVGPRKLTYRGQATNRRLVQNRFLSCQYRVHAGQRMIDGIFTIGFDRRHGEYTMHAIDSSGTYSVNSKGKPGKDAKRVKLYGTDNDPRMTAMGYTKEFGHVIGFEGKDTLNIDVFMVDTRKESKPESTMMRYRFVRKAPGRKPSANK